MMVARSDRNSLSLVFEPLFVSLHKSDVKGFAWLQIMLEQLLLLPLTTFREHIRFGYRSYFHPLPDCGLLFDDLLLSQERGGSGEN